MSVPETYKYAESHEWFDPETGRVGISDHAQAELSDVVYYEAPEVGRVVAAGEAVAVVESVKAASDIYAPVEGTIAEVNGTLEDAPGTVNEDAHGNGWLFRIEASPGSGDSLMDAAAYSAHIA